MKKNKIAAVVVTYNRKELLCKCIEKLLDQSYKNFDILIIDNHSTDGTKEEISSYINEGVINYHDTGSNLGGAGGFNYGIRLAAEEGYSFVWVMDDDSMPKSEALAQFIEAGRSLNGRFGFLSSRVLWTDGNPCKMNVQRRTLTKNLLEFENDIEPVVIASFVSMFIPVKIVKKLGLPIKEFFIWTDDWEFSRRISRKYPCYAIRSSVVIHETVENTGADISRSPVEKLDRFAFAYRNEVYLYKREGIKGIIHILLRTPLHLFRVL
ncbi:MAG: glycosyltransferase family 2 protein, partial [Lachnospiraceae bacterium]|nr:glycosyltransferase family 2 protein [Lachnospiraceae bacterium]